MKDLLRRTSEPFWFYELARHFSTRGNAELISEMFDIRDDNQSGTLWLHQAADAIKEFVRPLFAQRVDWSYKDQSVKFSFKSNRCV